MSNLQSPVKVLVIFPYRFREFDSDRFEIKCLQKHSDLVVHELIDTLHKQFTVAYHTRDKSGYIERFSSLLAWRKEYLRAIQSCNTKPYVINFVSASTFKELFVNFILSNSSVYLIQYNNPGVPSYNNTDSLFSRICTKYKFIFKRSTFKWFFFTLTSVFVRCLSVFFCRRSDYILSVNPNPNPSRIRNRTIPINSFDYSMFVRQIKRVGFNNNADNTIVYLDTGAPLFKTDSFLSGNKHPLTIESWYPSLVRFFDTIEKRTSKVVVVAAHPKHKYPKEMLHYFGNRKVIHSQTPRLVAQSNLVLVTNSTAVSYAVMHDKPVLVLLSDELIADNNILLKESNYLSSILGCPSINIDQINEKLLDKFSVNKDKYLAYKTNYLSSRLDRKTNCEIIIDEIINHESTI